MTQQGSPVLCWTEVEKSYSTSEKGIAESCRNGLANKAKYLATVY